MAGRGKQIRIKRPLKQLVPYLLQAKEQNMNEADTVRRVTKVLEDSWSTRVAQEFPFGIVTEDLAINETLGKSNVLHIRGPLGRQSVGFVARQS